MPRARQWCGAEQTDKKGKTKEKIKNADAHFASRFLGLQTIAMKLSTAKKNPNGICVVYFFGACRQWCPVPEKITRLSPILSPQPLSACGRFSSGGKKKTCGPAGMVRSRNRRLRSPCHIARPVRPERDPAPAPSRARIELAPEARTRATRTFAADASTRPRSHAVAEESPVVIT